MKLHRPHLEDILLPEQNVLDEYLPDGPEYDSYMESKSNTDFDGSDFSNDFDRYFIFGESDKYRSKI